MVSKNFIFLDFAFSESSRCECKLSYESLCVQNFVPGYARVFEASSIGWLTGGKLLALRGAIAFWLSGNGKISHIGMLWDVFENTNWTEMEIVP